MVTNVKKIIGVECSAFFLVNAKPIKNNRTKRDPQNKRPLRRASKVRS